MTISGDPSSDGMDEHDQLREAAVHINRLTERLALAERCARLLQDHLTGDGGFGGRPTKLDCQGCREAVAEWRASTRDAEEARSQ